MKMGNIVLLLCLCSISSIAAKSLKFTTLQWILPGSFPGTPPIKFVNIGDSVNISCQTNDTLATVELFVSPGLISPYESVITYSKGRIAKTGQIFMITKAKVHDHGSYKCVANNMKDDIVLVKGLLMVRAPKKSKVIPKIFPNNIKSALQMERGSNLEIKCESPGLLGKEKSYLTWKRKNDKGKLEDVEALKIKRLEIKGGEESLDVEVLSIKDFSEEDIGEYVCQRKVPDGYMTFSKVTISMKGYCAINGKLHKVGESFISLSCTGVCKCDGMNNIACVSLCPPHFINCPPGEIEVSLPIEVSATPKCFCKRKQCVNISDHCYFEDKLYTKGQSFVSKSCSSCQCIGFDSVSCVSICPPIVTKCNLDEMVHYAVKEANKEPKCYCRQQTCVKITDVCKMKPESGPCFALFRRWHYNPSSESCENFDYGGCDGNPNRFVHKHICEQICMKPTTVVSYAVGGVKSQNLGDCGFEEKWYKKGERFISKYCKRNCTCVDYMSIECELLCPPPPAPSCPAGTMVVSSPKAVTKSPRCFCVEEKCVKTTDVCKMKPEGGSCYAHIRRWYYNPSLKSCESFIYGGCEGNPNNFESKRMCNDTCIKDNIKVVKMRNEGTKVIAVSGKIMFSAGVGTLPKPSCASVKLLHKTNKTEVSGPGMTSSTSFYVSDMDISQGIGYHLISTRSYTASSSKTYTISCVVNVGWCKDQYSSDWIRDGDYVTQNVYEVTLEGEKEKYKVDINVSPIP